MRQRHRPWVWTALALLAVALAGCFPQYRIPGSFSVDCRYSHSRSDDPIVHPGHPGASHFHDFYGNTSTSARSTYVSMRSSPTTCRLESDGAGYWTPAAFLDGVHVPPTRIAVYYFGGRTDVESLPRDLRMISGGQEGGDSHVRWSCGFRGSPGSDRPFDCSEHVRDEGDGLTARLDFPACWSGGGIDPSDLAYGEGWTCPEGFERHLPKVSVRVHYPIVDPCLGAEPCGPDDASYDNIELTFSSGDYTTFHGDFWNTWDQKPLNRLVETCLNAGLECGKQA